ncbi:hypothetical protein DF3PB_600009 [uncultured Defluviicoccus sp.]|uniref:Uncharacterized protein n=1 Tax=metagenome TaxID=256318 RepID=A0A380TIG3_9ZZZZ|nr:hypothetical protein DF3PB_600009 [uncultured Defluviicoccus sp.]
MLLLISVGIMKTVYLDNHVLSREEGWAAIRTLLNSKPALRLVVSEWNLVELGSHADRDQVCRRAQFVDSLKPLWMVAYIFLQRLEVKKFIWQDYYGVPGEPVHPFKENLSEVLYFSLGRNVPLGFTATKWVKVVRDPATALAAEKAQGVDALATLQAADAKEKKNAALKIFPLWIAHRIPDLDPSNKAILRSDKDKIVDFCYNNKAKLFSNCPAVAVEWAAHEIRTCDPHRKPKESDVIDLFHKVMALPYCDFFVTCDGFVRNCATYVGRKLPSLRLAKIHKSINNLAGVF